MSYEDAARARKVDRLVGLCVLRQITPTQLAGLDDAGWEALAGIAGRMGPPSAKTRMLVADRLASYHNREVVHADDHAAALAIPDDPFEGLPTGA